MAFAGTVAYGKRQRTHNGKTKIPFTITLDSSYDTGGETVGADWDDGSVEDVYLKPNATYAFSYDPTQDLIMAQTIADGEQVADTTDLEAQVVHGYLIKKW
jgi:hypothetical protein